MTTPSSLTSLSERAARVLGHELVLQQIEQELSRAQPRWGYIELALRQHGWAPEDHYVVLVPEHYSIGGLRGRPPWIVPWHPGVQYVGVSRMLWALQDCPESLHGLRWARA